MSAKKYFRGWTEAGWLSVSMFYGINCLRQLWDLPCSDLWKRTNSIWQLGQICDHWPVQSALGLTGPLSAAECSSARTCRHSGREAKEGGQRGQDRGQGHHDGGPWRVSQPVTCPPHVTCYLSSHVSHWSPLSHMGDVSWPGLASILTGEWRTLGHSGPQSVAGPRRESPGPHSLSPGLRLSVRRSWAQDSTLTQ